MATSSNLAAASEQRSGLLLTTAGGLLLGTLGVFLLEAGQPPLTAVWFRCVFGLLGVMLALALTGQITAIRLPRPALLAAIACGALMALNWGLFFAAIGMTSIAVATIVFHVQPFFVMAIAALVLKEPVRPRQWGACAVALFGLTLVSAFDPQRTSASPAHSLGLMLCAGGALAYAVVTLLARRVAQSAGPGFAAPLALTGWQCAVGAVLLLPWVAFTGLPPWGATWGWLATLGLVHTALAYVLLYAGFARLPAAVVAGLQFVYPLSAIAVDALVYGRMLVPAQALGLMLMAGALLVVTRRD
jgi:drug/metabolite transporter (DMT)-like permease